MVPDFPGLGGLNVGDGALWEVDVEAQEVEVVNWFQFDWVTKEVVVDQCLDGWVGQEVFVVDNEAVVHVSVVGEVVGEVECCVLKEVVVKLMPGVLDQGDSDVAEGWRELGANPGPSDLFVCVVACPENAGVECKGNNGCDVKGVDGPLGGMLGVMSAKVGMVERIACGFCVHCKGVGRVLVLPVLDHGVDGINKAMLWD